MDGFLDPKRKSDSQVFYTKLENHDYEGLTFLLMFGNLKVLEQFETILCIKNGAQNKRDS